MTTTQLDSNSGNPYLHVYVPSIARSILGVQVMYEGIGGTNPVFNIQDVLLERTVNTLQKAHAEIKFPLQAEYKLNDVALQTALQERGTPSQFYVRFRGTDSFVTLGESIRRARLERYKPKDLQITVTHSQGVPTLESLFSFQEDPGNDMLCRELFLWLSTKVERNIQKLPTPRTTFRFPDLGVHDVPLISGQSTKKVPNAVSPYKVVDFANGKGIIANLGSNSFISLSCKQVILFWAGNPNPGNPTNYEASIRVFTLMSWTKAAKRQEKES